MAVLSVWQPLVPLGNFGTVRCGQRLESTLVTRRLFSATCGSSKRHTAPVCPWPTFSPSPICYLLGHVWQIEMAHHTVCHLVCLWPASFPGTLRPLGVSAPRICRVFAQKKVGIFDRWDRIVYIRYHFSCGLDRKDACWLSFTPLTGFLHSWFFSEAPIFFKFLFKVFCIHFIQFFSPQSSTLYSLRSSLHNSPCLFPSFVSLHHILLQTIFKLLSGLSSQFFSTLFIQQTTGQQNGCRASCLWGSTQTSSSAAGRTESTLSYIIYIWLWFWRLGNDCRCLSGGSGLRWFNDV